MLCQIRLPGCKRFNRLISQGVASLEWRHLNGAEGVTPVANLPPRQILPDSSHPLTHLSAQQHIQNGERPWWASPCRRPTTVANPLRPGQRI